MWLYRPALVMWQRLALLAQLGSCMFMPWVVMCWKSFGISYVDVHLLHNYVLSSFLLRTACSRSRSSVAASTGLLLGLRFDPLLLHRTQSLCGLRRAIWVSQSVRKFRGSGIAFLPSPHPRLVFCAFLPVVVDFFCFVDGFCCVDCCGVRSRL